mgnify:CR=1 FL=1
MRHVIPEDRKRGYDVHRVLQLLFDTDSLLELRRDFGVGMVTAFARVEGVPVGVVANNPGHLAGAIDSDGADKAARFLQLCDAFDIPVVTLVDTPGAFPGIGSEERHVAEAIAVNLREMILLEVPMISVVIGEGGSGGALGIGVTDRILILENAYYSVISPEGCAGILWKSGAYAEQAARSLKLTSRDLLKLGVIDDVMAPRMR